MATRYALRTADGQEQVITGPFRIGRDRDCEICLVDGLVSHIHASVWVDHGHLLLRDERSRNGTFVNGRRLKPGANQYLHGGDQVRVGDATLTVTAEPVHESPPQQHPAPAPPAPAPPEPLPLPATRAQPAPEALPLPATRAQPAPEPLPLPATRAQPAPEALPLRATRAQPAPEPLPLPATRAQPAPEPLPLPATRAQPAPVAYAPAPAASQARTLVIAGGCVALALLCVCVLAGLGLAAANRPALSTALAPLLRRAPTAGPGTAFPATPGPGTAFPATAVPTSATGLIPLRVLSTSPAVTPLSPTQYAATSQDLADALAAFNQTQLHFIADARNTKAPPSPGTLDEDLRTIAAQAFKVGLDGETLGWATVAQDKGSDAAGPMSALYTSLAGYGFAQAIDAQNLRASLAAGSLDLAQAVARVADYGARAWNPSVADPGTQGNPFVPYLGPSDAVPAPAPLSAAANASLQNDLGPKAGLLTWIAAPTGTITRTVSLPLGPPLADPQDPALLATLITPAGQADGHSASQAAAAGLQRLGAVVQPRASGSASASVLAALWAPPAPGSQEDLEFLALQALSVSDNKPRGDETLRAFAAGLGLGLASSPPASGGNQVIAITLFAVDQKLQPVKHAQIPVQAANSSMTLTISDIQIQSVDKTGPAKAAADLSFSFDVGWQTNQTSPQGGIWCNSDKHLLNGSAGSIHFEARYTVNPYPGYMSITCAAGVFGSLSGHTAALVFVGDPAEATANAQGTQQEIERQGTLTQAASNQLTEQAGSQTAEFAAKITQIAAQTAQAQAAGIFSLNGTFNLVQNDASGCTFTDAPSTGGLFQVNVDFNKGTAGAAMQGGGGGTRTGLRCDTKTGDMAWQQTYTASFTGSIDQATGALSLKGTLTGTRTVTWSNCKDGDKESVCPNGNSGDYTFPVTLGGTVDKAGGTGKGTWAVPGLAVPQSGDWSAGK